MRKIILLLCLVMPVVVGSCALFAADETVEFELPQWPEYLPELEGWSVQVTLREPQGPQGIGVAEALEAPPDKRHISFKIPKNQPCCIIATPITQNQFFKPAGTIYPYSQKITWSGGYSAQLYTIIPDCEQFNWEKLLETLEQKQTEDFYNPWLLDTQQVLEGIAYRNFTATKLRLSKIICVPLDFEVFSSYVPENEYFQQKNQTCVTVKIGQPELFALRQSSGTEDLEYGIIISATSTKNISLEVISMPIFKEDL
ncbi:MAG: hypothetical protein J5687_01055 [Treponema sp.]|nr:hypothetical protein [Treponema sp.]